MYVDEARKGIPVLCPWGLSSSLPTPIADIWGVMISFVGCRMKNTVEFCVIQ